MNAQTAPSVTDNDVAHAIIGESYFTAAEGIIGAKMTHGNVYQGEGDIHHDSLGRTTICVLVLRNGFTVVGTSACVSSENFDAEIGKKLAREKAIDKVWELLGYALRDRLHHAEEAAA
jgi:hypothetical protein